jgi:hypothetical protein
MKTFYIIHNNEKSDPSTFEKMYRHRRAYQIFYFLCIAIFSLQSCKKFVEVNPPVTSVTGVSIFNSDATAAAVLTGLYTKIVPSNYTQTSLPIMSVYGGLSADELTLWSGITSGTSFNYYKNILSASTNGAELWTFYYVNIFTCNSAIAGMNTSTALTPAVKQQLLGEAYFMRGLFYFYLTNLYGDVPLVLTTDYTKNASMARTPANQVYQQVIADLKNAQNLLSANYLDATLLKVTPNKLRPTKWAATALLSRVYLYYGDLTGDASNYKSAAEQASTLISNSSFSLSPLSGTNSVFKMNSTEAIWQLQPINTGSNTEDAKLFIIPITGLSSTYYVYLSNNLLNSFEPGDNRKTNWISSITVSGTTYYYAYKYQSATLNAPVTEYYMILRLAEQYLIRAEAEAEQGDISDAQSDLNVIRTRAGLPNTTAATQNDLLAAIQHERQIEFFTEMGHRWLDLKRSKAVDAVMTVADPLKGSVWNSYQQLYPLPFSDLQTDPNLKQNTGY